MPFTSITATDVDAKSPLTDALGAIVDEDFDYLKATVTDGASAPQEITGSRATFAGTGTALTVTNDATISGTLSVGVFFSSEQVLTLYW